MTKTLAKVLAPVAMGTAKVSTDYKCSFFFNQPKMPSKLMSTVK